MNSCFGYPRNFYNLQMFGGRFDFHPFGYLAKTQGNFSKEKKVTIGVVLLYGITTATNNARTVLGVSDDATKPDVDSVIGLEISGGGRIGGFSVDVQCKKRKVSNQVYLLAHGDMS